MTFGKLVLTCGVYFFASTVAFADFRKNEIAKVGKFTCGFSKSWFPVSKSRGRYSKIKSPTSAHRAACKTLVSASKVNLAKLPDLSQLAKSRSEQSLGKRIKSVSGTPPTLAEILTSGPTTVFWRPGVVGGIASGSPTPEQCSEFFAGNTDGHSGGFLACYLSQNAGQALTEVVRAGTTMCYLKNMPTNEVLQAGGFTVTRGTLPGGSVTRLFETPAGSSPRVIKIGLSAGGQNGGASTGIIKVFSSGQIASSGDIYKYEMIFCEGESPDPQEIEKTRITASGEFISSSFNSHGGNDRFSGTVRAFLRSQGNSLVFDDTRSRTASFSSSRSDGGASSSSKSYVEITGSNEIINKSFGVFPEDTHKAYSISRFSGSGTSSMRFFEGAIKQSFAFGDFNGATEYRDSFYASAPANSYVSSLAAVDLAADSFYQGTPTVADGTSSLTCASVADIEVSVDMENDAMRSVAAACESERLDGVNFCQSNELTEAQQIYGSACLGQ
jgi:hypothetical protein